MKPKKTGATENMSMRLSMRSVICSGIVGELSSSAPRSISAAAAGGGEASGAERELLAASLAASLALKAAWYSRSSACKRSSCFCCDGRDAILPRLLTCEKNALKN